MDSNSPYTFPADALAVESAAPDMLCESVPPFSSLAQATAGAAFSSVLPKLQALLHSLHQPNCDVMETLAHNITGLQQSFAETLYEGLCRLGIDLSLKITLRLDKEAQLVLVNEHPDYEAITTLLVCHPELSAAFAEIAAQSAALRDLRSLSTMILYPDAASGYSAVTSRPGENAYQISMKGDMNHFYFIR